MKLAHIPPARLPLSIFLQAVAETFAFSIIQRIWWVFVTHPGTTRELCCGRTWFVSVCGDAIRLTAPRAHQKLERLRNHRAKPWAPEYQRGGIRCCFAFRDLPGTTATKQAPSKIPGPRLARSGSGLLCDQSALGQRPAANAGLEGLWFSRDFYPGWTQSNTAICRSRVFAGPGEPSSRPATAGAEGRYNPRPALCKVGSRRLL